MEVELLTSIISEVNLKATSTSTTTLKPISMETTCFYHSRQWRSRIEHVLNVLKSANITLEVSTRKLCCSCGEDQGKEKKHLKDGNLNAQLHLKDEKEGNQDGKNGCSVAPEYMMLESKDNQSAVKDEKEMDQAAELHLKRLENAAESMVLESKDNQAESIDGNLEKMNNEIKKKCQIEAVKKDLEEMVKKAAHIPGVLRFVEAVCEKTKVLPSTPGPKSKESASPPSFGRSPRSRLQMRLAMPRVGSRGITKPARQAQTPKPATPQQPAKPAIVPNSVSKTLELNLKVEDMGCFITKTGFTFLVTQLKDPAYIHYDGHKTPEQDKATFHISASSPEKLTELQTLLESRVLSVTQKRKTHRAQLIRWQTVVKQREEARKKRVLTREQTEHRHRSHLENAAAVRNIFDPKSIGMSHYQRSVKGNNQPREISARSKRGLNTEEKQELRAKTKEEILTCDLCHHSYSDRLSNQKCRHHPGFITQVSNSKPGVWSCCNAVVDSLKEESELHQSTGCHVEEKHLWRLNKQAVTKNKKTERKKASQRKGVPED